MRPDRVVFTSWKSVEEGRILTREMRRNAEAVQLFEDWPEELRLTDGRTFTVPVDKSATDVLAENGVHIDVKCSDGICGVCKCKLVAGNVDHRDFVLSNKQRETAIILCQSRAAEPDGVVEVEI